MHKDADRAGAATGLDRRSDEFVSSAAPIDLTNCDREPIHIPGTIQPHGVLLVLREPDLTILQASANTEERLGIPVERLLGTTLAAHVGAAVAAAVVAPLGRGAARAYTPVALTVDGSRGARLFDGVVHRSDGVIVLELEPQTSQAPLSYADFYELVRETMTHVERATTLIEFATAIAAQMRRITGFDRVWVYKFHEDNHGEIIAESRRAEIETWLGMHYPASDIPVQARALFLKHRLRMIPDRGFTPVPLVPRDNPHTARPLDMGWAVLRGVSPIHIEYLENMGVTASLVISLVKDGRLWGLISGHHYAGPKVVPYATRTLCEFLAQAFSTQLGMAEQVEDTEYALRVRAVGVRLLERMARDERWTRALTTGEPTLLDLVGASGAAVCVGDEVITAGETPSRAQLAELVAWLAQRGDSAFSTSSLPAHFPPARAYQGLASGLVAARVSVTHPDYVLWFRPESRELVPWAGDPRKPVQLGPGGEARLHPRGSFALWEETVKGTSAPWRQIELDAAAELRSTVIDVLLGRAEAIAALNAELGAANEQLQQSAAELEMQAEELAVQTDELQGTTDALLAERDAREALLVSERDARAEAQAANKAKGDFLAMMSHELRTPLNAIQGHVQLIDMELHGPVTDAQHKSLARVTRAQQHLLGLINGILDFARLEAGQVVFAIVDAPLDSMLADVEALLEPSVQGGKATLTWGGCLAPDGGGPLRVLADPEKVRQVMLNLVSNALKFTASGGDVAVTCAASETEVTVEVRDTGRGIAPAQLERVFDPFVQLDRHLTEPVHQGVGLGLAISRDLARGMGGELTAESAPGIGSLFTLTLLRAQPLTHHLEAPATVPVAALPVAAA